MGINEQQIPAADALSNAKDPQELIINKSKWEDCEQNQGDGETREVASRYHCQSSLESDHGTCPKYRHRDFNTKNTLVDIA